MRTRGQILTDLERSYTEAFQRAQDSGDEEEMARLDFDYQRDQLWFEVALDLRALLSEPVEEADEKSLLDRAKALRNIAKGRLP